MKYIGGALLVLLLSSCAEFTAIEQAIGNWVTISGETAHRDSVWYVCSASRMDAIIEAYPTHPKFKEYMEYCGYGHLMVPNDEQ